VKIIKEQDIWSAQKQSSYPPRSRQFGEWKSDPWKTTREREVTKTAIAITVLYCVLLVQQLQREIVSGKS
jgi:hypothetical protein